MQDAEKIANQAEAEEKYLAQAAAVKSAIDHLKMRKALKAAEMQTEKEQDVIMKVAFSLASSGHNLKLTLPHSDHDPISCVALQAYTLQEPVLTPTVTTVAVATQDMTKIHLMKQGMAMMSADRRQAQSDLTQLKKQYSHTKAHQAHRIAKLEHKLEAARLKAEEASLAAARDDAKVPPIHACIYTCIHACIHTYVHTYIHRYTHTHTHTHTFACLDMLNRRQARRRATARCRKTRTRRRGRWTA